VTQFTLALPFITSLLNVSAQDPKCLSLLHHQFRIGKTFGDEKKNTQQERNCTVLVLLLGIPPKVCLS
jgi:hypothetical protein